MGSEQSGGASFVVLTGSCGPVPLCHADDDYHIKFLERCAERYPELYDGVGKKKKWSMWRLRLLPRGAEDCGP